MAAASIWAGGFGTLLPRAIGLSGLTIVGQLSFLLALPLLSRLFSPGALGMFTIYLSAVNIAGPLVGLKFESALFGQPDRQERCLGLRLSLSVVVVMSLVATVLLVWASPSFTGGVGDTFRTLLPYLPLGFLLSGMWNTSTAWAVRESDLRTLSIARFLQPFSMTVLQVGMGLAGQPPVCLVIAHLLSHALYTTTIFARCLSRGDLATMASVPTRSLLLRAVRDRRFPLYTMPAFLMTVLVNNAPPVLMGMIFGTGLAGHYGVAYRVVTSPLTVVCMPLANLFTSEASQSRNAYRLRTATRFVLTFSICAVAAPVLAFGLFATPLCEAVLGPQWSLAGQIMVALAVMGAAQAVASPLVEVPSIYHRQEVRLIVDSIQLVLFFLPLAIGWSEGWGALPTIRLMAAGGAIGYVLSAVSALALLRDETRRLERAV